MTTIIDRKNFELGKKGDYTSLRMPLGAIYGQPGKLFHSPLKLGEEAERLLYMGIIDEFDMLLVEAEEYSETRKALEGQIRTETFGEHAISELDEEQLDHMINDTIDQAPFWLSPAYIAQSLKGVNILVDLLYDLDENFLEQHGAITRQWLNKIAVDFPEGTRCIWEDEGDITRFPNQAVPAEYQLPDGTILHARWGNGTFELRGGHCKK